MTSVLPLPSHPRQLHSFKGQTDLDGKHFKNILDSQHVLREKEHRKQLIQHIHFTDSKTEALQGCLQKKIPQIHDEQWSFHLFSRNCQNHGHYRSLKLQISTRLLAGFPKCHEIPLIQSHSLQKLFKVAVQELKKSHNFLPDWHSQDTFLKLNKQAWKRKCWQHLLNTAQGLHLQLPDWRGIFQNCFWILKKHIWTIISSHKI